MQAACDIRLGADLPLKAEANERIGGAQDQDEHVGEGQVEEEPKRRALSHRTLREDDYVENVADRADDDYEDERADERFDHER